MEELQFDIREYETLLGQATRQKVKDGISLQIRKLQSELVKLQEQNSNQSTTVTSIPVSKTTVAVGKPTKKIDTYAWDQSDKFMKIYVDMKGIKDFPAENIKSEFTATSFKALITKDNVTHEVHVANLWGQLVPDKCYHKAKTDMLLLMLKKQDDGKTWAYVTDADRKKNEKKESGGPAKKDTKKDPEAGMMDLMRQMYEDGDDEMKKTIAKAMTQSQDKQAGGGGMPGMGGGMPGMGGGMGGMGGMAGMMGGMGGGGGGGGMGDLASMMGGMGGGGGGGGMGDLASMMGGMGGGGGGMGDLASMMGGMGGAGGGMPSADADDL